MWINNSGSRGYDDEFYCIWSIQKLLERGKTLLDGCLVGVVSMRGWGVTWEIEQPIRALSSLITSINTGPRFRISSFPKWKNDFLFFRIFDFSTVYFIFCDNWNYFDLSRYMPILTYTFWNIFRMAIQILFEKLIYFIIYATLFAIFTWVISPSFFKNLFHF